MFTVTFNGLTVDTAKDEPKRMSADEAFTMASMLACMNSGSVCQVIDPEGDVFWQSPKKK